MAQLVEHPKGPIWCISTDVGLNHEIDIFLFTPRHKEVGKIVALILATPSLGGRRNKREVWGKVFSFHDLC